VTPDVQPVADAGAADALLDALSAAGFDVADDDDGPAPGAVLGP